MFLGLSQKVLFKGRWNLRQFFFKQNYCHACHTRFAVFLALPSCCVSSHTKMAAAVKNLTFTDEELLLHVLVGFKTEKEGEGVDWETVKAKWDELNKNFIEKYHKNFQESFCEESANNRNNKISDLYWALCVIKGANRQIDLHHLPKAHN